MDPTRLLVAGDFHGDKDHQGYIYQSAANNAADAIFQLGDYGFFPHIYKDWLPHQQKMYSKHGIPMYVIDGNHENFEWLKNEGHFDASGFSEIQPGLIYVPRGTRWNWNGENFLGFGGAPSIDKNMRTQGIDWWPEELPSMSQIYNVLDTPYKADHVFMHDSPMKPPGLRGYKDDPLSENNREAMNAIVEHVQPQDIYHGHYHYPYVARHPATGATIHGLGMNGQGMDSWKILDLGSPPLMKDAAWEDVVEKARRLILNGAVTILRNTPNHIVSHVIGEGTDNDGVPDEHEVEIVRDDPTNPLVVTRWSCDCAWGQHSWGRTRKWKKYNGRGCSHMTATLWRSMSTPQDTSEMPFGYQVPRGQKGPESPEQQPVNPQMAIPGLEEEGPQVAEEAQGPMAIPPQPFPKSPQRAEKYPQRQQLYLWDITSLPGQETPAEFTQLPPEQRTPTLQMPGAFSSVQIPHFRVIESDFIWYAANEFELQVQQLLVQGRTPVVQILHPIELEARGGKHPQPNAVPYEINQENTPLYNVLDLGYDPDSGDRINADTPPAGAPELRGKTQTCPAGKRGVILDLDTFLKQAFVSIPLHLSGPLHPHSLEGWVEYGDIKLLSDAKDPYQAGY